MGLVHGQVDSIPTVASVPALDSVASQAVAVPTESLVPTLGVSKGDSTPVSLESARVVAAAGTAVARLPIVAVQPLQGKGVTAEEADLITDALAAELQKTDSVRVLERSQMDKILAEQGFQNSGACSGSECVVQMGQMLGIDQMVVGTVGKLGGSYILNVRIAKVESGEVARSVSRNLEAPIDAVVTILAPVVAKELVGAVPDLAALEGAQRELREAKSRAAAPPPAPAMAPPAPKSNAALWWTAGGVAVAGGAAAAYFLLSETSSSTSGPAPAAATETDVWVNW